MSKIYLDNAATTPVRKEVIEEMVTILQTDFGNPSSTHSFGRSARNIVETARKQIAKFINAQASEIIFTSGATEADTWILTNAVSRLGVQRIMSSRTEHHAVLHTLDQLQKRYAIEVVYLPTANDNSIDLEILETYLNEPIPTLVSLMYVNNETGIILPIEQVASLCKKHKAYFHSDTVQAIGKIPIDAADLGIDFLVAAAHKFHGPKGVGFVYIKKNTAVEALIIGGEQEKGLRAGTESVHNIAGMAKALELSLNNLTTEQKHIEQLKQYTITQLTQHFPDLYIVGGQTKTLYNIINVILPIDPEKASLLLFQLDIKGFALSRGSACQSGSSKPSHVLAELVPQDKLLLPSLRISFSHYNTFEEIDALVAELKK